MGIIGAILGIIIFLFALAWTQGMFGDATSKLDEGRTFELVNRLRANVKESYFGQSSYGSSATDTSLVATLMAMGKVPSSARDGTNIVSPYGGNITIMGRGRRFNITVADLDDETCVKLGSRFAGGAAAQFGVMNITTSSTAVHRTAASVPEVAGTTSIQSMCAGGASSNDLTITFR